MKVSTQMLTTDAPLHKPVMLREVLHFLAPQDHEIYVDGTFGVGGYTRGLLESAHLCRVYGIDRDPEAIVRAESLEKAYAGRFKAIHGRFSDMKNLMLNQGLKKVNGIVLDVGVSSPQIDTARRGFSFMRDGPLDMRMDFEGPTAADVVNTYAEASLAEILFHYGDEHHSRRIARKIVDIRQTTPFQTTHQLAEVVRSVVPRSVDGIDAATRTFQALRIYVNQELDELEAALTAAEELLLPGGRLVVVSFHSLEDRLVKTFLKKRGESTQVSRHMPANRNGETLTFSLVSKRAIKPTDTEKRENPRARSAKMRVAIRTDVLIPAERR